MSAANRRAVIDIGTNSVKLLVADVTADGITPVLETSEQTRLGKGFYDTRRLQRSTLDHTATAVKHFAGQARELQAASIRVIATSAARDATNAQELLDSVHGASGLEIEIISGEQEAEWAFKGATCDPALAGKLALVLDVGGGSTEFILGKESHQFFSRSFPIGSVRLLEQLRPGDPPSPEELAECLRRLTQSIRAEIKPAIDQALIGQAATDIRLVGTGGTTSILARIEHGMTDFDRTRIEGTHLARAKIRAHLERFWSLPLAERRNIVGLPPERADVILTGTAIYDAVMEELRLPELVVSTRGMRFGALLENSFKPAAPPAVAPAR
ncbi:MAG: Ppx/GppA phosphatase family protein [Verrucomicrobiota bacterium]